MPPKTIALAGATGFLGRYIAHALLSRGHTVRALARSLDKARAVLPREAGANLRVVEGDARSADAQRELLAGADACVNAIGIIREADGQTFKHAHVETTRALVRACEQHGVPRFIQVSALGVHDEGRTKYQQTKWEAEQIVRRSGLAWTILRPSMVHGPDGEFIQTAAKWCRGKGPPWIFLPYFKRAELTTDEVPLAPMRRVDPTVQPVWVGDVAEAVARCIEREEAVGETYNLAGSERLTWPQLLTHIRDNLPGADQELEPRGIPSELAAPVAHAAARVGLGSLLPFDEGMAILGAMDSTATLDKAAAHLDFAPRPFRETFADYARHVA